MHLCYRLLRTVCISSVSTPSRAWFDDISSLLCALMATTFSRLVSKAARIIIPSATCRNCPRLSPTGFLLPLPLPLPSVLDDHPSFLRRAHGLSRSRRPRRRPRTHQAHRAPFQILFALFHRFRLLCIFKQCTISHQQYLFRSPQTFSFNCRLLPRGLPGERHAGRHPSISRHHKIFSIRLHSAFLPARHTIIP